MEKIEAELLIRCSKYKLSESDISFIKEHSLNDLNWREFAFYCIHHKVTNIVYKNLVEINCISSVSKSVRKLLSNITSATKERNTGFLLELQEVNNAFLENGIKTILLKGGVIGSLLYKDFNLRELGDLDFLVKTNDIPEITKILIEHGYIQGEYDPKNKVIIPASRKQIIYQRINSHELIEFLKCRDNINYPVIPIDINFSILWKGSSQDKYYINIEEIFDNTNILQLQNTSISYLKTEYHIVQLCGHFYSEGMFFCFKESWLHKRKEVILMRICDIYELIKAQNVDWMYLSEVVKEFNVQKPVCYSLYIVNEVFPDTVPKEFFDNFAVKHSIIDQYYNREGQPITWKTPLWDRLFDIEKKYIEIVDTTDVFETV